MQLIFQDDTMLAIKPMGEYLFLGIKFIKNGIGISLMAGSKDDDLIVLTDPFQKGQCVGPYVNAKLELSALNIYFEFEISFYGKILITVNESLIKINKECLLAQVLLQPLQYKSCLKLFLQYKSFLNLFDCLH